MARSIDDWFADAWASEPDPAYDQDSDDPMRRRPRQPASTVAGAGKLPRRPVGATRFALDQAAADQDSDAGEMRAAMQRIRARDPGIRARKLARRLRDRGWPAIALGEVRALLKQTPPPCAEHGPSPRIDRTVGPPHWPVRQRTLVCRACGAAVSARGLCRCP